MISYQGEGKLKENWVEDDYACEGEHWRDNRFYI